MGLDAWFHRRYPDKPDAESESVAYFRKVNFLHAWVERHLNDGKETNCEDVPMNLEQIAGLAGVCREVLDAKAHGRDVLPTSSGFFFGSTDYDEYYLADVAEVLAACEAILGFEAVRHLHGQPACQYSYHSWW